MGPMGPHAAAGPQVEHACPRVLRRLSQSSLMSATEYVDKVSQGEDNSDDCVEYNTCGGA